MELIDTHTHIFAPEFDSDIENVIQRACNEGIIALCLPNIDLESISRLNALCSRYPKICFPMMGLHPTSIGVRYLQDLKVIRKELEKGKYKAIGEIGIDLYWDKTYQKEQIEAFEEQLRWSIEYDLPVSIHSREAFPQVLESIHKINASRLRGVFHSFGGSRDELEETLQCSRFMFGINGIVTYKKASFCDYLPLAPIDRILLETDAPYLSPVPFRGKRNEPAYLIPILRKVAEIYGLSLETVAEKTTENARRLFGIAL
ncbi:MAG: TatD family hydrolase [Candidatus Azobacteroides sp.]|nr:TatD family hydrolase [Candidatus Azobacteroides sp.]